MFPTVVCLAFVLTCCSALYSGDVCPQRQGGICTLLEKCPQYWDVIRDHGLSNSLATRLRTLGCGFEGRNPLICCKAAKRLTATTESAIRRPSTTIKKPLEETSDPSGEHRNLRLLPTNCGVYDDDRIIGGLTAGLNQFPWMAQLLYKQSGGGVLMHQCGGSLINERYVLTAAHCIVFSNEKILQQVVLGEHDVKTDPDCYRNAPEKCYYSKKMRIHKQDVIVHEGYSSSRRRNDIALIRLPQTVNLSSDNISPICLPTTEELRNQNLTGVCAIMAGWGATVKGLNSVTTASILQYAYLPVIRSELCTDRLRKHYVDASQLCTDGIHGPNDQCSGAGRTSHDVIGNVDSCNGDSGGPLVFTDKVTLTTVRQVQWGILSFGGRMCAAGVPTVYTRVASYMNWILDNMKE